MRPISNYDTSEISGLGCLTPGTQSFVTDTNTSANAQSNAPATEQHPWDALRIRLSALYPYIPSRCIWGVIDLALREGTGYAGLSGLLKDEWKIRLTVASYIRNNMTNYRSLLPSYQNTQSKRESKRLAAAAMQEEVDKIAHSWRSGFANNPNTIMESSNETIQRVNATGNLSTKACDTERKKSSIPQAPEEVQNGETSLISALKAKEENVRPTKSKPSSRHSYIVKEVRRPVTRVSKRIQDKQIMDKLERVFAVIDLNPVAQVGMTSAPSKKRKRRQRQRKPKEDKISPHLTPLRSEQAIANSTIHLQSQPESTSKTMNAEAGQHHDLAEEQISGLVAGTALLQIQDTGLRHGNGGADQLQGSKVQQASADNANLDPDTRNQVAPKANNSKRSKTQARNKRNKRQSKAARALQAAESSLQILIQNPNADARQITRASRLVENQKARVEKKKARTERRLLQKKVSQEEVMTKMTGLQSRENVAEELESRLIHAYDE